MSPQRVQWLVTRRLKVLASLVKSLFTTDVNKDNFSSAGVSECVNYPFVHHILDASVLEINRLMRSHTEGKPFYSGESFAIALFI